MTPSHFVVLNLSRARLRPGSSLFSIGSKPKLVWCCKGELGLGIIKMFLGQKILHFLRSLHMWANGRSDVDYFLQIFRLLQSLLFSQITVNNTFEMPLPQCAFNIIATDILHNFFPSKY